MSQIQILTDKVAIGLSSLCVAHCFLLPVALGLLPSLAALPLGGEAFHFWMVLAVIPTSAFALFMGCKKHKRVRVLAWGITGIAILVSSVLLGEELLGEYGEKVLTLLGASFVAWGHFLNYRLCKTKVDCHCPEHTKEH